MVNTNVYAARPGQPPKARRIGDTVYFTGEVYAYRGVGVASSTFFENIPKQFTPDVLQVNGGGMCYELANSQYMIYIEQMGNDEGRIRVSQPGTKIPATSDWQGYALSNIPPFIGKSLD